MLFISFGFTPVTDLNIWPFLSSKFINDMASIGIDKEEAIKILKSLEE